LNSLFKKIKLFKSILVYLWNPKNVSSVLKLGNSVSALTDNQLTIKNLKSTPKTKKLLESKYGTENFDFPLLHTLPPKSLGHTFANYVKSNNLDPKFYDKHTNDLERSDYSYLVYRMRKTHDIWHIVTGFDTSEAGEAGLIAFYYAQLRTPLSRLIICLSFIHFLLRYPSDMPKLMNSISRGWQLGKTAKPLIAVKWEEIFDQPLIQVQKDLKLAPTELSPHLGL